MNPFRRGSAERTSVLAAVPVPKADGAKSTLRLYDPIDSWGGDWGVSAKEFVAALDALPNGTTEIELLINSPGGEVWDGMAILNALRRHPAKVTAIVEGIAASAASFIAAGADELVMMRNSELFIHNAWGFAMGDAEEMRLAAEDLDHLDKNLASIYAQKSGQSVEYWLSEMPRDRWFSAEDAVGAKLADRIEGVGDAASARARFDLSVFARSRSRVVAAAADAQTPVSTEPVEPNRKGNVVAYDELKAGLGKRLGLTDAVALDDATILAAVDEVLEEQAEDKDEDVTPVVPDGTVLVDEGVFAALKRDAEMGREARNQQISDRRDGIVQAAIKAGKILPESQDHWRALLDSAEERTATVLASMQANSALPVAEIGTSDDVVTSEDDRLMAQAGWAPNKESEVA
jgi:ATP-dependent Clp endopeptidase proteolytic subunit ClpP